MAKEYADSADTAEKRAFIMSIVRVGAEMITAAAPAITAALTASATGGASVLASSASSTAKQASTREAATEPDDETAETIEKKRISSMQRLTKRRQRHELLKSRKK